MGIIHSRFRRNIIWWWNRQSGKWFIIKHPETDAEAIHKIEKNKKRIQDAGFKYEWFTGEISLCDNLFLIKESEWKAFANAKRGTNIYNNVDDKIYEHIKIVKSEPQRAYHSVYRAIRTYNPNGITNDLNKYITAIDLSSVSERDINGLVALADKMEQFISDVRAIKRYYEIMGKKK